MTLFSTDSQRFKDLTANYDSRKFPLCAPHDGTKGLAFQRFANDFLIAIAAIDLKDPNETYDLSETLVGIDEGGSVAQLRLHLLRTIRGLADTANCKRLNMWFFDRRLAYGGALNHTHV